MGREVQERWHKGTPFSFGFSHRVCRIIFPTTLFCYTVHVGTCLTCWELSWSATDLQIDLRSKASVYRGYNLSYLGIERRGSSGALLTRRILKQRQTLPHEIVQIKLDFML